MHSCFQGIDGIAFLGSPGIVPRFVLENQKEPAGNRLPGTDLPNELEVVLLHQAALLIVFVLHLPANGIQMLIDIRTAGKYLELDFHRADLQIGIEGIDDILLFPVAAKQEIDGNNLNDLHIPVILRIDDTVGNLLNRKGICHRIDALWIILLFLLFLLFRSFRLLFPLWLFRLNTLKFSTLLFLTGLLFLFGFGYRLFRSPSPSGGGLF